DLIRKGIARVVVGARSALFAPLSSLGVIIIDEEHEGSYKQDAAPRYVSRDVAVWLAEKTGALLVLGSATPSLEALHKCETEDNWVKVEMPERVNGRPLPVIEVVDMGREFGGGNKHMFSRKLQQELRQTLERKEKAVLLLNQRGFAQFVLCRECGFVPECPSCSTSLTYHEVGQKLTCHHCGYEIRVPVRCPHCQSPYLKRFGAGTQRVEAELRALFQDLDCTIIRMDSDTTKRKGAHQKLLEEFASCEAGVLLGTQMIAKGLDFDDVTLVGVINADTVLKLPDFRAPERTFDLIEQVAGRSGRSDLEGKVIVQTYNASHYAIRAAATYRRDYFLNHDLTLRKELGYPPYVRLINVFLSGSNEIDLQKEGMEIFKDLNELFCSSAQTGVQVYPPTPCVLSRVKKVFRYHLLIKAPHGQEVESALNTYFRKQRAHSEITVAVDVDPMSLL
ncbi:MAG: primosomal protein N', partial [Anaerotardibacter sp.]